jgi:outer membrane receptor protein involved in Fe transport
MDFKGSMALTDNLDLSVGVYNVLNTQSLVQAGIVDSAPIGGANVYDVSNRYGSLDQYSFQPSRNYQVTLKASF